MSKYKYKVGDRVQIRSRKWITKHKPIIERFGEKIIVKYELPNGRLFDHMDLNNCGEIVTIENIWNSWYCENGGYSLKETLGCRWYDEMFETKWSIRFKKIKDYIYKRLLRKLRT